MQVLYPLPDVRRTPLSLLRWWESRRGFYNKVVGATGLITLSGLFVLAPDRSLALAEPGWVLVVMAYGVLANAFYTGGWLLEVVAVRLWGRDAPVMGPLLYRQGLIFSVGLTLFPLVIGILLTVARVILAVVG
jgi:hypothetical protein